MKAIILKSSLLSLVACFAAPAFGQATGTKPETVPDVTVTQELPLDVGQLDGVNYVNDFFGLSLSIPGDWILVQGRNKEIAEGSKKLLANEEAKQRAEFEKSIERSTILLSLPRVPSGAPNNASLLVIAERLSSPAIKNGVDAIRTMEVMTKNTSFLVEFQSGVRSETINGVEFGVATIKTTSGTDSFMQKVYMVVKHGYGVEFFFTYKDPAHLATYDAFMKTVKIK